METLIKTRKARVRKETNPQITALKKSVSVALKAAWNVEAVKLRKEKAVRKERGTLEKKVEEQREALKAIKASVDAFLVALTPVPVITPDEVAPITPAGQTLVETLAGPLSDETASVVLDPSAAA
jgi:seryl-tRNA synthetase